MEGGQTSEPDTGPVVVHVQPEVTGVSGSPQKGASTVPYVPLPDFEERVQLPGGCCSKSKEVSVKSIETMVAELDQQRNEFIPANWRQHLKVVSGPLLLQALMFFLVIPYGLGIAAGEPETFLSVVLGALVPCLAYMAAQWKLGAVRMKSAASIGLRALVLAQSGFLVMGVQHRAGGKLTLLCKAISESRDSEVIGQNLAKVFSMFVMYMLMAGVGALPSMRLGWKLVNKINSVPEAVKEALTEVMNVAGIKVNRLINRNPLEHLAAVLPGLAAQTGFFMFEDRELLADLNPMAIAGLECLAPTLLMMMIQGVLGISQFFSPKTFKTMMQSALYIGVFQHVSREILTDWTSLSESSAKIIAQTGSVIFSAIIAGMRALEPYEKLGNTSRRLILQLNKQLPAKKGAQTVSPRKIPAKGNGGVSPTQRRMRAVSAGQVGLFAEKFGAGLPLHSQIRKPLLPKGNGI
jgi:hypothetical protein